MASAASIKARKPSVSTAPVTTLGGRLFIAVGIVAAMAALKSCVAERSADQLKKYLNVKETTPVDMTQWQPGKVEEIELTLVTADYDKLACALDKEVAGTHCEYKSESEKWPKAPDAPLDNNRKDVIQPYSAVPDNALILVAGLWAQPEVAMRLHAEPPQNTPTKNLARFIARCKVRPIERVENASIRWNTGDAWAKGILRLNEGRTQVAPWIAVTESCTVRNE